VVGFGCCVGFLLFFTFRVLGLGGEPLKKRGVCVVVFGFLLRRSDGKGFLLLTLLFLCFCFLP